MLVHTFVKYITLNSQLCITCPLAGARLVRVEDLGFLNQHPTTSMGLHTGTDVIVDLVRSSRDRKESRTPPIFETWLRQCGHYLAWISWLTDAKASHVSLYVIASCRVPVDPNKIRPQPTRRTSWKLVGNVTCCKPGRFLHSTCAASCQPACRDRSIRLPTCSQPKKVAN